MPRRYRDDEVTLHRVQQNDTTMNQLWIGVISYYDDSDDDDDDDDEETKYGIFSWRGKLSNLGICVGKNSNLTHLLVDLDDDIDTYRSDELDIEIEGFINGLKQNTSINSLKLDGRGDYSLAEGGGCEILKTYQESNRLIELYISSIDLLDGGDRIVTSSMRSLSNLRVVSLINCRMRDEQMLPMVEALRGNRSLERLVLSFIGRIGDNTIGNTGCEALATLLEDPNTNIRYLNLSNNVIRTEGSIVLVNSLANNTKLERLNLTSNPIDYGIVDDAFFRLLCNTTSIDSIYSSNHTLAALDLRLHFLPEEELSIINKNLLILNTDTNKSRVAIKKILKYHPNIDMEQFFYWDEEGEQSIKALPYILAWFERAKEAVVEDEEFHIETKKLSAIYQFAQAMPIQLVPPSHMKDEDRKRKRDDTLLK